MSMITPVNTTARLRRREKVQHESGRWKLLGKLSQVTLGAQHAARLTFSLQISPETLSHLPGERELLLCRLW